MCLNQIENLFYDFLQEPEQIEKQSTHASNHEAWIRDIFLHILAQNEITWIVKTENVCRLRNWCWLLHLNKSIYAKIEPGQKPMFEQLNSLAGCFVAAVLCVCVCACSLVTHQVRMKFKIKSSKHTYTWLVFFQHAFCAVQLAKRSNRRLFIYFLRIIYDCHFFSYIFLFVSALLSEKCTNTTPAYLCSIWLCNSNFVISVVEFGIEHT